jgi:hypothetical protein
MLDLDLGALVEELESLGVKFTVVPRLDGSLRLNCWRFPNAWANRHRINHLLAERIENSPDDAAHIAEFINERSSAAKDSPQAQGSCESASVPGETAPQSFTADHKSAA